MVAVKNKKNDKKIVEYTTFLLTGEDRYSIEIKISEIISEYLEQDLKDFNYSLFNEENMDPAAISSELYSLPVIADHRVVVVSDIDKAPLPLLEMLSVFLKKNIGTTILILTGSKPDKRKTFFKELSSNKTCLILEFKEKNDREIIQWLNNYIRSKGYSVSVGAIQMLSLSLSSNLSQVSSEADKLIEYCQDKSISEDDVERVMGISKKYNIFKLQKAVAEKNLKYALMISDNILKNKNNKTDPIAINLFLSRLFTSAFEIGYNSIASKISVERSAAALGYNNPWKDADILTCAKTYKASELLRSHRYFLECDIKLKSSYQTSDTAIFLLIEKIILHSDDNLCLYLDYFETIRK